MVLFASILCESLQLLQISTVNKRLYTMEKHYEALQITYQRTLEELTSMRDTVGKSDLARSSAQVTAQMEV